MLRPLLMIPGPIEISEAVQEAAGGPAPSHLAPDFLAAFGRALRAMRGAWLAGPDSQPFVVAGGGTIAMESAVVNLFEPGDAVLLVNTGYFSDRMAEMLARRGVGLVQVRAEPGQAPPLEVVAAAVRPGLKALVATHVDTSTGVRVDAEALCGLARDHGLMTVFDGVCATAGEAFHMEAWGADLYLTASQKALGLPAGLALWVASPRALAAREALRTPPPLSLDWEQWRPIMRAYEEGRPSYFSTPATTLVRALDVGLREILDRAPTAAEAMQLRFDHHARAAEALRAAWRAMGLALLPGDGLAANTLSALRYPDGVDAALVGRVLDRGVVVAGGLHPAIRGSYFRVGHMGVVTEQVGDLALTVRAVAGALDASGHRVDADEAVAAFAEVYQD